MVFDEDMGTYLPRQLVGEKLKEAQQNIGSEYGTPEIGPITSGLGEIYQYTVEAKPGYEDKFYATELRTIQDWLIKRQLSGTRGIVEINSWGGFLKQYEVAIDPGKLNGFGLTLADVFAALRDNNQNTGGSYIEKGANMYLIRARGLVGSIEEINKIIFGSHLWVKNSGQPPAANYDLVRVLVEAQHQSFPSGYTVFYVTFFGFLMYFMYRLRGIANPVRISVSGVCLLLIAAVPFSRVYLGVHWFTDVLGGVWIFTNRYLLPDKPFDSIANCSIGLTSANFYERAATGEVQLEKGEIAETDGEGKAGE